MLKSVSHDFHYRIASSSRYQCVRTRHKVDDERVYANRVQIIGGDAE